MAKKKSTAPNSQKLVYSEEVDADEFEYLEDDAQNGFYNDEMQTNREQMQNYSNGQMQSNANVQTQSSGSTMQSASKRNNKKYQMQGLNSKSMQNGQSGQTQQPQQTQPQQEQPQMQGQEQMQNANYQGQQEMQGQQQEEKQKKERNWVINTGNMAIIASSLSLVIDVIHKLLRMVLVAYSGLIIFLYILSGILSVFALIACIKYGFKSKTLFIDAYLTGVSFIALILI